MKQDKSPQIKVFRVSIYLFSQFSRKLLENYPRMTFQLR